MAVADSRYKFIWCDIGAYGVNNDSFVFNTSAFCQAMERDELATPGPARLPDSNTIFPYYFVADDAFTLRKWLFKPLKGAELTDKQHEYNYR